MSGRTAVTNFPKPRGLSPANGAAQNGSDAAITPATERSPLGKVNKGQTSVDQKLVKALN